MLYINENNSVDKIINFDKKSPSIRKETRKIILSALK